eukprot:CAMPEP_0174735730 /NCGR_PEP_ID=MMETSP1094-20130205/65477_1 /TAXON_ID=156173 /ORGANISM="Chrysochromulina brevifilum, Strain UTEX LB 985" /LENGTH=53 /DNA_ID=CAMNT_0015938729 /DNA_START=18 /DNA_END=176 /DNA_ORIENTATION=+
MLKIGATGGATVAGTIGKMGNRAPLAPVIPERYPFCAIPLSYLLEMTEWKPHQ